MDLQVTYGGRTAGGTSTTDLIVGPLVIREFATETLEFEVGILLVSDTPANFAALEQAARAAYTTPEASFEIKHGSTVVLAGDPAATTAFNVRASFDAEPREEYDSDRTGYYTLRVSCNVPAHPTRAYRRDATTSVRYTAARQELVVLSGTYTAGGGRTALQNYQANAPSWIASQLGRFGGSSLYEVIDEGPLDEDHDGGLCSFSITYRRVLYSTSVTGVRNESVSFTRARALLDNPSRLVVRVDYQADVDYNVVTDLHATWQSIRTVLRNKALTIYGASVYVVEGEDVSLDQTTNRINATTTLLLVGAAYTFRRAASTSVTTDPSGKRTVVFTGVYRTDDAGQDAKAKYDADADAWTSSVLAAIDGGVTWQRLSEGPLEYDDETAELRFARRYQELTWTTGAAGVVGETVSFRRTGVFSHGIDGEVAAIRGIVSYATSVDRKTAGEATMALYTGSIKPYLLTKVASTFGGTVVVESEDMVIDPERNAVSVNLAVLLVGVGSNTLEYSERAALAFSYNLSPQRRYDGKPNSYNLWSGGLDVTAVVEATVVAIGPPELELFGSPPPPPPASLGGSTSGEWVAMNGEVAAASRFIGATPEGGSTQEISTRTTRVTFLWVGQRGDVTPSNAGVGVPNVPRPDQIGVTSIP